MGTCNGESAQNKQVIAAPTKEDNRWSNKKMAGDEGLNTVECLRGRLLKERQASRVAKGEAESMGNKLVELEMKLREEIKLREKAERKLKFLKKKLESFNKSSMSGQSEHSDSSVKCESSVSSSSRHSEACESETKHHTTNPALSENSVHNSPSYTKDCDSQITNNYSCNSDPGYSFPQILSKNQNPSSVDLNIDESRLSRSSSNSSAKDSISQGTDNYNSIPNQSHASSANICNNPISSYEDLKNDDSRFSSLRSKSSVREIEEDHEDFFDNSLALVPVNLTATPQTTSNPKPVNEIVVEALNALRVARERLQGSMGTRQMVQVGPT